MQPPLPASLRLGSPFPFVGRSKELATLRSLIPRLPGEGGRVALLGGEAGSGKSRLVREVAAQAATEDVLVLYGASDPVVRTPFGPFVGALSQLVRGTDVQALREHLGPAGGELTRLLPDLAPTVGGLGSPGKTDPDTVRHRLHTAVEDLLSNVSARVPVLLLVEDLHWADTPTLGLLRHIAWARAARMLVLATFRDTDVEMPAELAGTLADLRRCDDVVRLKLGGLGEESVAEFVGRSAGGARLRADPDLVASLRHVTGGNPFLLGELWRALVETGSLAIAGGVVRLTRPLQEIATPDSVREVVSHRLTQLEPAARDVLELAAVVGSEFELEVLRSVTASDVDLAAGLESAQRGGMIEELPSRTLAYRFTHELVRNAIYDRLTGLRRARLHLMVGEALERSEEGGTGPPLAALAHHYSMAAPVGGRERAVEYAWRAAGAAAGALAFGEAVSWLQTALDMGVEDDTRRAEMQVALGSALDRAGSSVESLAAFREAAAIARQSGSGELLARAAIGFENACTRPGLEDAGAVPLLDEAAALLSPDDSPLRVRLLAALTRSLNRLHGDDARGDIVRRSAIEMARRLDDRSGLATVLSQSYWSNLHRREVLEMLDEARDLAAGLGDVDLEVEAMEWRVASLMFLGDIGAAEEELAAAHEKAARTRQPFHLHVAEQYASALALLAGRLADALAAAERSREWGHLLTGREPLGVYGIQMFSVLREQGRLQEFAPILRLIAGQEGTWRAGLAALLADIGMGDEAREQLRRIRSEGLESLRESLWLASLTYLTDACSAVDDGEVAALLYPELAPLSGANVAVGHGVAYYGAADRYLGMLAATMGDADRATRHFEAALELNRTMGAKTWVAHTAYEYGRLLLGQGERPRGEALLREAAGIATWVGMPTLRSRVRALAAGGAAVPAGLDDLSPRELDVLHLLSEGLSNRRIGAALHISEHTAANHIRSILDKTGSANRTEAVAYAFRRGLAARPLTR